MEEAVRRGPQIITRRGVETAIVLSYEAYRKLLLQQKQLSVFFRESPLVDVADDLDLARDRSPVREDMPL